MRPGPFIAGRQRGQLPSAGKLNVNFSNIVFDFVGLFLVAILVRNLYTGDPCEGVRSLPPQTKNPRNGPGAASAKKLL